MRDFGLYFYSFWSLPLLAIVLLVLLFATWQWLNRAIQVAGKKWTILFFLFRACTILICLLFLVNPIVRYSKTEVTRGTVYTVVDTSRSMALRDSVGGATRFETAIKIFSQDFVKGLREKSDLAFYGFDENLYKVDAQDFHWKLSPGGTQTDIGRALSDIADQSHAQAIVGVILASDGAHNGPNEISGALAHFSCPVYTVGLGQKISAADQWKDIALTKVVTEPVVTRGIEATIKVELSQSGYTNQTTTLFLSEDDRELTRETVSFTGNDYEVVELGLTPDTNGTHIYTVYTVHQPDDRVAQNDIITFPLMVTDAKIKILYIEGTLRWEYKFLKRLLEGTPHFESSFLIHTGSSQLYSQNLEGIALEKGFPGDTQELAKFDVLILGDLPRAFLTDSVLRTIEEYVEKEGGGVLLIGGNNTLLSTEYVNSTLEKIIPVRLNRTKTLLIKEQFRPAVSADVLRDPILSDIHESITEFMLPHYYPVKGIKPGATQLLLYKRKGRTEKSIPLIAQQQYGKGRSMVTTCDQTWKWGFGSGANFETYSKFWTQELLWLAQQSPELGKGAPALMASTDKVYYESPEDIVLTAHVNPEKLRASVSSIQGVISLDERQIATVDFHTTSEENKYQSSFMPPEDGTYDIKIIVTTTEGKESVPLSCMVGRPFKELERSILNEALLRSIAKETGGGYFTALNASEIPEQIGTQKHLRESRISIAIIDSPFFFVLFIILLCVEWFIRRRKNLI